MASATTKVTFFICPAPYPCDDIPHVFGFFMRPPPKVVKGSADGFNRALWNASGYM
jgi:hypothetical protein